ncbi:NAD(P)(+) transhydrogenase (Re/Si-specific) subunit beta [Saccharophagus degradans]|uniref:NAD(P) transhydrogenase subunit beta n=1 Tax=Saccharophagus degradans (strain 2-40 / ATCC 43961 / DSM 17024) TaxID=203122 RepID=Q21L91_SACD2|nr:NAD(P)(+) transhydrogenase (Re/Si-specific) subunit beta [Saccharophagus degradans]ABD80538.1 NAD(P) transhydrogenase, beta subunit [Saccharophagus degradans 2-40]WGO97268.1 NAD(P)(+) transhydrogenase (Re/Si-specific) subunit beta [Saccharophagus degradans]
MSLLIEVSYFLAALLFIFGLKRMSSPKNARQGIVWAGVGMLIATLATFFYPGLHNYSIMMVAIVSGSIIAWWTGRRVAMTDMPQMIALYNGMGGGAAAAIAALELTRLTKLNNAPTSLEELTQAVSDAALNGVEGITIGVLALAVFGAIIGTVAFSGSLVAFLKLQGIMKGVIRFKGLQAVNAAVFISTIAIGVYLCTQVEVAAGGVITQADFNLTWVAVFFAIALVFGVLMTVPIGGADMPVVISLFNALTGLAVGVEGYVLGNAAMMIAGVVVGSAGTLLTQLMAKAMNRPIANVLFSNFGSGGASQSEITGSMKAIEASDVGVMMAYAEKVLIVPGYGMAVAQAQHKIWELTQLLQKNNVTVKFAIHPVAGRMPGHMNVLLAEAGVPYDIIEDLDEINEEFVNTDVVLVIGANDVVNPEAKNDKNSPIYGMPILNAYKAKNCVVIKRGQGRGFSGVENALFYADNTRMLYGDGQKAATEIIHAIKELE